MLNTDMYKYKTVVIVSVHKFVRGSRDALGREKLKQSQVMIQTKGLYQQEPQSTFTTAYKNFIYNTSAA